MSTVSDDARLHTIDNPTEHGENIIAAARNYIAAGLRAMLIDAPQSHDEIGTTLPPYGDKRGVKIGAARVEGDPIRWQANHGTTDITDIIRGVEARGGVVNLAILPSKNLKIVDVDGEEEWRAFGEASGYTDADVFEFTPGSQSGHDRGRHLVIDTLAIPEIDDAVETLPDVHIWDCDGQKIRVYLGGNAYCVCSPSIRLDGREPAYEMVGDTVGINTETLMHLMAAAIEKRQKKAAAAEKKAQRQARRARNQKEVAAWGKWAQKRREEGKAVYPLPADVTAPIPDVNSDTLMYPSRSEMAWVVLRGVFSDLADRGVIPTNPAASIKKPRVVEESHDPRYLTPEQLVAYITAMEAYTRTSTIRTTPPRSEWLVVQTALLLATGLRIGEVNRIRWDDKEFDPATGRTWLHIYRLKKKGDSSIPNRVALPDSILRILQWWQARQPEPSEYMLPMKGDPSKPMTRSGKTRNAALEWARLPHRSDDDISPEVREALPLRVSPHDFRRTVATMMAQRGEIGLAARQLGHATVTMTERHYAARGVDVDNARLIDDLNADAFAAFSLPAESDALEADSVKPTS